MPRPDHALESVKDRIKVLEDKFGGYTSPVKAAWQWIWSHKKKLAGGTVALVACFAGVAAVVLPYVESSINRWADARTDEKLKQPLSDLGAIRGDVRDIKGRLDELSPLIHDWIRGQMQKNSQLPAAEFRQKLPEIAKALEVANTLRVDFPQPILKAMNARFAGISKSGTVPWQEELQILNYRSLFNATSSPVPSSGLTTGHGSASFTTIPKGARMGFTGLTLHQFDQTLDGGIWNSVVFIDCTIRYKGGPVTLRNVRFINCRFIFEQVPSAKKLADELLASAEVSIDING